MATPTEDLQYEQLTHGNTDGRPAVRRRRRARKGGPPTPMPSESSVTGLVIRA
jgi:hypothetical protein